MPTIASGRPLFYKINATKTLLFSEIPIICRIKNRQIKTNLEDLTLGNSFSHIKPGFMWFWEIREIELMRTEVEIGDDLNLRSPSIKFWPNNPVECTTVHNNDGA